jgi:nucleoside-diphosphate-sugar epimerase
MNFSAHPSRVLLGGSGLIGRGLRRNFDGSTLHSLQRVDYQHWWDESRIPQIRDFLSQFIDDSRRLRIYIACGVLSPREDPGLIQKVNELIPINIARALEETNSQIVTFGTIHESFEMHNEYIDSKRRLAQWLQSNYKTENFLHLRLHTLYDNDLPKKFMFLGALYDCISRGQNLQMSSGRQLREFHHVDDDIQALEILEMAGSKGFVDLNHGSTVSLFELATDVSKSFLNSGKIDVGFFPDPLKENYKISFEKVFLDKALHFREANTSIVEIFKELLLLR